MTYTPAHIANYFLCKADNDMQDVTPLKLLKIVYIAYGWWIAVKEEKLFQEHILAWKHGPVVPSLSHQFKIFGRSRITEKAVNLSPESLDIGEFSVVAPSIDFSKNADLEAVLDKVWDIYGGIDGWTLRNMTHEPDSPWTKTWAKDGPDGILSDDEIKEYYQKKIDSYVSESCT